MFPTLDEVSRVAREDAYAGHRDRTPPRRAMSLLKQAGLLGAATPAGLPGALDMSRHDLFLTLARLGMANPALGLVTAMHFPLTALLGNKDVPRETAERLAELASTSVFCSLISEQRTRGEDPFSFLPTVTARWGFNATGEWGWFLDGVKEVGSNAGEADYAAVSCKATDDDSMMGALILVVKMKTNEGTLAEGITITPTGDTLGMRGTRSDRVTFKNVFVAETMKVLQTNNFLRLWLVENGDVTFGGYTAAFFGAGMELLSVFNQQKGALHPATIEECRRQFLEAEEALLGAATLFDNNAPLPECAGLLINAKLLIGEAIAYLTYQIHRRGGLTGYLWPESGKSDGRLAMLICDGIMVNAIAPSLTLCEAVLTNGIPPAVME